MTFNGKTILITGGTGSFGKEFITQLLLSNYKPKKIIVFSRDELKQYELSKENLFSRNKSIIRYFIGDIRDKDRLNFAFNQVDIVVHAAALKHVDVAEYNPFEAIKTNIIGSQNVIECAINNNIKKVLSLSTDKASSPSNIYGATKLCSDKLFVSANNYIGNVNIKFSVVRYGNVFGSRGSVIPYFVKNLNASFFTVTDKRMTRFSIGLKEGVEFVIGCIKNMHGGEIFIPKIPSYNILDLVKALDPEKKIKYIGIRSGEKLHEQMISKDDAINTIEFKNYYIILPFSNYLSQQLKNFINKSIKEKIAKPCKPDFSYVSNTNKNFMSVNLIRNYLKRDFLGNNYKFKK